MFEHAAARALEFGIQGVTYQLTQGVVKNIIPAIASTNALVAAACTLETLKLVTLCSTGLNNYMMYVGTEGVYTHTVAYEKDPACPICSPGVPFTVQPSLTLREVLEKLQADPVLGQHLTRPSVSYGSTNLYMRGALEEETSPNLDKAIADLVEGDGSILHVNDKKLVSALKVRLKFQASNGEMEV